MGIGHALNETTAPYYPSIDHGPKDFQSYMMPGAADMCEVECEVLEFGSRTGLFGAKGVGEMVTNSPIPAIVNAINNALGVSIRQIPVTPEVILRALDEKAANRA
jgi:CO/xanthine dehydrogenase Mo-binding subunit